MIDSLSQRKCTLTPWNRLLMLFLKNCEKCLNGRMLLHHNLPAHIATSIKAFLGRNEKWTVPKQPYMPDIYLLDFYLFSINKKLL